MEWENIFVNHTSDKALISKIYKELNSKKATPFLKMGKGPKYHSSKDIQRANRYMKNVQYH